MMPLRWRTLIDILGLAVLWWPRAYRLYRPTDLCHGIPGLAHSGSAAPVANCPEALPGLPSGVMHSLSMIDHSTLGKLSRGLGGVMPSECILEVLRAQSYYCGSARDYGECFRRQSGIWFRRDAVRVS